MGTSGKSMNITNSERELTLAALSNFQSTTKGKIFDRQLSNLIRKIKADNARFVMSLSILENGKKTTIIGASSGQIPLAGGRTDE